MVLARPRIIVYRLVWLLALVVGTEHNDNGELMLRVKGDGSARVSQKRAGETREFSKQLDAAALNASGKMLADNELTRARTSWAMEDVLTRSSVT